MTSDARVRLGEVHRRLFGLLKRALGIWRQERGLESYLVDGGNAGLVEPSLEVGGLVVDAEGWRREAIGIGAGGQHQGGALTWGCSGQEPNSVAHRQNS